MVIVVLLDSKSLDRLAGGLAKSKLWVSSTFASSFIHPAISTAADKAHNIVMIIDMSLSGVASGSHSSPWRFTRFCPRSKLAFIDEPRARLHGSIHICRCRGGITNNQYVPMNEVCTFLFEPKTVPGLVLGGPVFAAEETLEEGPDVSMVSIEVPLESFSPLRTVVASLVRSSAARHVCDGVA